MAVKTKPCWRKMRSGADLMRISVKASAWRSAGLLKLAHTYSLHLVSCVSDHCHFLWEGVQAMSCMATVNTVLVKVCLNATRYIERLSDTVFVEQLQQAGDTNFTSVQPLRFILESQRYTLPGPTMQHTLDMSVTESSPP